MPNLRARWPGNRLNRSNTARGVLLSLLAMVALQISVGVSAGADREHELPEIAALGPQLELVILGGGDHESSALSGIFVAPEEHIVQQVTQRLREYRADYRQLAPSITVHATPGDSRRARVAARLESMFTAADLSHTDSPLRQVDLPDDVRAALVAFCARENRPLMLRLLAAIEPYLRGAVLIYLDEESGASDMQLLIRGTPAFTPEGVTEFPATWD